MKKLMLAALLLSSQASFAHILNDQEASLIIKAIKASLATNDLNCVNTINNNNMKASSLNLSLLNDAVVEINEGEQPVIKFTKTQDTTEIIALVTTNDDLTVVTELNTEAFQLTKNTVERNTGTIVNPRFEVITEVYRKLTEKLDCK